MSNTFSIRLPKDLAIWLKQTAEQTGQTQGEVVRRQLEKARSTAGDKPWMALAGAMRGPRNLSTREGFGRR